MSEWRNKPCGRHFGHGVYLIPFLPTVLRNQRGRINNHRRVGDDDDDHDDDDDEDLIDDDDDVIGDVISQDGDEFDGDTH